MPLNTDLARPLLLCRSCRHVFWDAFPSDDEIEAHYAAAYTEKHDQASIQAENRSYYRAHALHLLNLAKRSPEETSILDFGCSYPTFLEEAKAMGFLRTVGVEPATQIDSDIVEIIRPNEVGNLDNESFDVVRFCHVLEHLPDPKAVLQAVLKKVKPGGLVYVGQPCFPVFKYKRGGPPPDMAVYPEHLQFFNPISLAHMVESSGLRIHHLFTHQKESEVFEKRRAYIDIPYAWIKMRRLRSAIDQPRPLGGYPKYCGTGSAMYAYKSGP